MYWKTQEWTAPKMPGNLSTLHKINSLEVKNNERLKGNEDVCAPTRLRARKEGRRVDLQRNVTENQV